MSLTSIHLVGTVALLVSTLAASRVAADRKPEPLARPLETIEWSLAGFSAMDNPPLDDHTLSALRPTSYLSRTYSKPGLAADLFIAFYAQQRAGESMHSPKHCLPGSGWEIWDYGRTDVATAQGPVTINRYSISRSGERRIVLYWYQSRNRIIASEYLGKFILARDTLLRRGTAASIVRIIVPDNTSALAEGSTLASQVIAQLQHCFE